MQITKPKTILQKALPLFLSLAMLAGLLPVSPLGTVLIRDAEARGAVRGPRGGAAVAGPRGVGRGWSPGQCCGRHSTELCPPRACLGGRGSSPGLRRRPPGRSGLCGPPGGSGQGPLRRRGGEAHPAGGRQSRSGGWSDLLCGQRGLLPAGVSGQ